MVCGPVVWYGGFVSTHPLSLLSHTKLNMFLLLQLVNSYLSLVEETLPANLVRKQLEELADGSYEILYYHGLIVILSHTIPTY